MSITVVGSIAFDAVETPFGARDRMLGGAATHFALAASLLDEVRIVGPVGEDFGDAELEILETRGSNIDDVERVAGGKTFFWKGRYGADLNTRDTLDTQLNVFEHFAPKLSEGSRASEVLFLANIQPGLQLQVREQCPAARFVALDSMNLWIDIARDELLEVIRRVDCLILNDEELRQLTAKPNLISAAHEILGWGPSMVVAKQGEYGSALITAEELLRAPGLPAAHRDRPHRRRRHVRRRFRRLIASQIHAPVTADVLRNAMAYGTALASFNVEQFGTEGRPELDGLRGTPARPGPGPLRPLRPNRRGPERSSTGAGGQSGRRRRRRCVCVSCDCARSPTPRGVCGDRGAGVRAPRLAVVGVGPPERDRRSPVFYVAVRARLGGVAGRALV